MRRQTKAYATSDSPHRQLAGGMLFPLAGGGASVPNIKYPISSVKAVKIQGEFQVFIFAASQPVAR